MNNQKSRLQTTVNRNSYSELEFLLATSSKNVVVREYIEQSCIHFLQETYSKAGKQKAVIAVSGGIDSVVSLTLLTRALGAQNVIPVLLPYGNQSMVDAKEAVAWNSIPSSQIRELNIKPVVDAMVQVVGLDSTQQLRLGNFMARTRMMCVFDIAKAENALVCGTENKSEKYLAYFTRFGDEASDVEPIQDLFKTQIRDLAEFLHLPDIFLSKAPSAGLWQNQTDESELGFSYADADVVLAAWLDLRKEWPHAEELQLHDTAQTTMHAQLVEDHLKKQFSLQRAEIASDRASVVSAPQIATTFAILQRVYSQQFKHNVPYVLTLT